MLGSGPDHPSFPLVEGPIDLEIRINRDGTRVSVSFPVHDLLWVTKVNNVVIKDERQSYYASALTGK